MGINQAEGKGAWGLTATNVSFVCVLLAGCVCGGGGVWGGVMRVCVLLRQVGLGQSEIMIDEASDLLLLLVPPGGGDELQGVKKGIMEVG